VPDLIANPTKARDVLGWTPETSFETMVREMLEVDLAAAGLDPAQTLRHGN